MNTALETLLTGLNAALRNQIRANDGLFDPLENKPSPSDHYGHVCAALALACGDEDDWNIGRQALLAWLTLDASSLGHLPFNRFALLLLRTVRQSRGLAPADEALIDAGINRCTLRRSYPSNNWSLLAQACRLIEAPPARKATESRRLCTLLDRWTTPKGCFIDFPANPGSRFSTPLAYHHKALFLTALACWYHDDAELARHARRLLDWLVHCWDPAGYAGGFGRSTHSLFGDACLIAGMILMGIEDSEEDQPIAALCRRLIRQRRADGLLWLNPAGAASGRASWDAYMHLSVYNAWAAAVIAIALHLRTSRPLPVQLQPAMWSATRTGLFHDEAAGLAYLRTKDDLNVLISTRGQPPQSYNADDAEFRYAGGVIVHLRASDDQPVAQPGIRISRQELLEQPALAGSIPLLVIEGACFVLDEFDACELTPHENGVRIVLTGRPKALFKQNRQDIANKLLAALDWRFLDGRLGRNAVLHREQLSTVDARVQIELSMIPGGTITTSHQLEIHTRIQIEHLNPHGQAGHRDCGLEQYPAADMSAKSEEKAFPSSIGRGSTFAGGAFMIKAGTPYSVTSIALFPTPERPNANDFLDRTASRNTR